MSPMSPRLLRPRSTSRFGSLRNGLTAYWTLNETADSGDVTAVNHVTGGVNLTSQNTVPSVSGISGLARRFTAANSERLFTANGNASTTLFATSTSTLALWWRPNGDYSSATRGIISNDGFGAAGNPRGCALAVTLGGAIGPNHPAPYVQMFYDNGTNAILQLFPSTTVPKDTWHFICVRRNGSTLKMRINATDGTNQTLTATPFATRSFLHVGARYGSAASAFDFLEADVDEIALWSRELSDAEVSQLYNSGAGIDLRR